MMRCASFKRRYQEIKNIYKWNKIASIRYTKNMNKLVSYPDCRGILLNVTNLWNVLIFNFVMNLNVESESDDNEQT